VSDGLESRFEAFCRDVDTKHAQNRKDIHDLRGKQQEMLDRQHLLDLKLVPVLGNGKPGIVEKVDGIQATVQEIKLALAVSGGLKKFLMWAIPVGVSVLAIVIPVFVVLLQAFLKR
jgi:hypothetical protein